MRGRIEEKDDGLPRRGLDQERRLSCEMRVRVLEKDERVPQRPETLQLRGDSIDVSTREEQEPGGDRDAEGEEEHRDQKHGQARLASAGGDRQRDNQAHDVRGMVRRDVDHHARRHDRTRDGTSLERPGNHDGAADARRGERLIDEQLGKAEPVAHGHWQAVAGCARHTPKNLALRQVGGALQTHRQHQPSRPGSFRNVKKRLGLREVNRSRYDDGQDGGAEYPREPDAPTDGADRVIAATRRYRHGGIVRQHGRDAPVTPCSCSVDRWSTPISIRIAIAVPLGMPHDIALRDSQVRKYSQPMGDIPRPWIEWLGAALEQHGTRRAACSVRREEQS